MHRRGRGQTDCLPDVTHRGRVAILGRVALDEVENLLLAFGQIHGAPFWPRRLEGPRGFTGSCEHLFGEYPCRGRKVLQDGSYPPPTAERLGGTRCPGPQAHRTASRQGYTARAWR